MAFDERENCKDVFALLSDYLNLELPADACTQVEDHLAGCPPCIDFVESLHKTLAMCRRYRPTEVPTPISDQAREQLLAAYTKMIAARKTGGVSTG